MAPQACGQDAAAFKADLCRTAAVLANFVLQPRPHITGRIGRHQKGARVIVACPLVRHGNISARVRSPRSALPSSSGT